MTPIEILAAVFAILTLAKILILAIKPEALLKASEALLNRRDGMTIVCLILSAVVGYYVLTSVDIVEVAAVMLFTSLLMSLFLLPYYNDVLKIKEFFGRRSEMLRRSWWSLLIWIGLAVWVLYAVLV